jgi:hypothetical protein
MPGARIIQGATNSWLRSSPIIEPHSGRWMSPITPTNASAAISRTAPPMPSVPVTTSGVIEFGMIRRVSTPKVDSPSARDAVT